MLLKTFKLSVRFSFCKLLISCLEKAIKTQNKKGNFVQQAFTMYFFTYSGVYSILGFNVQFRACEFLFYSWSGEVERRAGVQPQ